MSNVCECPNPPGGTVRCPPSNLAICRVLDGEVISECIPLPSRLFRVEYTRGNPKNYLANWIFNRIAKVQVRLRTEVSSDILEILAEGKYSNSAYDEFVSFSLPLKAKQLLLSGRQNGFEAE